MNEKILELLEAKKYSEIGALLKDMNPADAAVMLEELPEQKMPIVFRLLSKELAADTFAYMDGDAQEILVRGFSDKELDEVMEQLFLDDQSGAQLSQRQRRQHHDHGVCGSEAQHDCGAGLRADPGHRRGERDNLYLLCH